MELVRRLIIIARPIYWLPAMTIYFGGVHFGSNIWTWPTWFGLAFIGFPMGILVYGLNDIADIHSDAVNERKGDIEGARVGAKDIRPIVWAIILSLTLFLSVEVFTKHYLEAAVTLCIVIFAYAYSFKPLRLKSRPLADSLSNGFWIACLYLGGAWATKADLQIHTYSLRLLVVVFLASSAVHAIGTLLDLAADKKSGDKTIGIYFGERRVLQLTLLVFAVCFWLASTLHFLIKLYLAICVLASLVLIAWPSSKRIKLAFYGLVLILPVLAAFLVISTTGN